METLLTVLRAILKFIIVWFMISATLMCMEYWLTKPLSLYWVSAYIFSLFLFYFGIEGMINFVNKLIK